LRREIESLLRASEEADREDFLPGTAEAARSRSTAPVSGTETIGPYRLLKSLGRGGMGDVFKAVREEPYRQIVALKIVKSGLASDEARKRFSMERQILASLNHPNIARLIDGGVTDDDRPYIVMEFVEGESITEYCDGRRLGVEARLRLFQDVCDAVRFAHQNLVIHRDLKPSNILVSQAGRVKLLDFGIAKLINPTLSAVDTPVTATQFRVMTPEYASPEQVRGESLSTSTDVYSLGVVLYELLTGRRPYVLKDRTPHSIAQVVCEQEPTRPSTRVGQTEDELEDDRRDGREPATTRSTSPERLRRVLRGDLDNIVLMALRKEPHRRYVSVEQFREDVARHLRGDPVIARNPTLRYRAGKYIRRHRTALVATAAALMALTIGLAAALWQADRATFERDRAETARIEAEASLQQSEEVQGFLIDLFRASHPSEAMGDSITGLQLLERGAARAEQLADQPVIQARMLDVVGEVYLALDRRDDARPLLGRSLRLRRDHLGDHLDTAHSIDHLARMDREAGQFERAEQLYLEALAMTERVAGPDHPHAASVMNNLAILYVNQGRYDVADTLYQRALEIFSDDEDSREDASTTTNNLAVLLHDRYPNRAEPLYRDALRMREQLLGPESPEVALTASNLALLLRDLGRTKEARELFDRALAIRMKIYGAQHTATANTENNLALLLRDLGELEEAERLGRSALAKRREILGERHTDVANSLQNVASTLRHQGRLDEAESDLLLALEIFRERLDPDHVRIGLCLAELARLRVAQDRTVEAADLYRQAVEILEPAMGTDHRRLQELRSELAAIVS
jgi:serine/threonine-protein kinase